MPYDRSAAPAFTLCRNTISSCHSVTSMVTLAIAWQAPRQRRQLVIVGRKQCAGTDRSCRYSTVAHAIERPSNVAVPRPISSRMTSERSRRLIEDRGGLDHLDHERRAPARQIVGRADAREQPVDDADVRARRRHERAHLRHHADQRVLAQKRRFAGHVGTGDEPYARVRKLIEARRSSGASEPPSMQSLSMKACSLDFASACSTTGWRPPRMSNISLVSTIGPHVVLFEREHGEGRVHVEFRQGATRSSDSVVSCSRDRGLQERAKMSCSRFSARSLADAICPSISASSAVVKRTAFAIVWRWRNVSFSGADSNGLALSLRHFDEEAEDIVVAHLQRLDAGLARRSAPPEPAITTRLSSRRVARRRDRPNSPLR